METNINYYKYLKYKSKYIELKKTLSGGNEENKKCCFGGCKCIDFQPDKRNTKCIKCNHSNPHNCRVMQ